MGEREKISQKIFSANAIEKNKEAVGKIAAAFFAAVFPGNVAQYRNRRNAFGLDTDKKRLARLFFQPVFIYYALKSSKD